MLGASALQIECPVGVFVLVSVLPCCISFETMFVLALEYVTTSSLGTVQHTRSSLVKLELDVYFQLSRREAGS